jgi:hypothetical protein
MIGIGQVDTMEKQGGCILTFDRFIEYIVGF